MVINHIPNILTLVRILLIPIFVICFYLPFHWSNEIATVLFGLAALTDWLDGYLARRFNVQSAFGAFLDPVADKLMVAAALILIVGSNPTMYDGLWLAPPALVIVGREITISALREWMAVIGSHSTIAVNMTGKVKTTVQIIALLLLLYHESLLGINMAVVGLVMLYFAALLTLWSMLIYLKIAWPILRRL